jgi:transcriptional regulator with XRE-family HTH domain
MSIELEARNSEAEQDLEKQAGINGRFVNALNTALVSNRYSQRKLCAEIGVTIGTMTKYMRGSINPLKVGTEVQDRLAGTLGVSLASLIAYYRTGEYANHITREDVTSWIRSEGAQEDLPFILEATTSVLREGGGMHIQVPAVEKYEWPAQILEERKISQAMRDRLGLSEDVMYRLSLGEFEASTVEAFALLLNKDSSEVEEAFKNHLAIEGCV